MSIPRAVLHCKGVLQLLHRELAAPGKGVCVNQLLDVAPERQWFGSDSARMQRSIVTSVLCWCVPSTCMKASIFTLWPLCLPFPVPALDPQATQAVLVWFRQLCTLWYNQCTFPGRKKPLLLRCNLLIQSSVTTALPSSHSSPSCTIPSPQVPPSSKR